MARVEEDIYEKAAATGMYTPEDLEWMRRANIRPATKRWVPLGPPVKLRPRWLAFIFRVLRLPDFD